LRISLTINLGYTGPMIDFFIEYKTVIIILHALCAAIGVGAATISDIMFFRFMKDGKIDRGETPVLDTLTKSIWFAIAGLILTGIFLFMTNPELYAASSKFLVKVVIVGFIILNGIFLTLYLHKRMLYINFLTPGNRTVKRLGFASGALSIVSWYVVFILGSIRSIPYSFASGLVMYLVLVVGAIGVSQVFYLRYRKRFFKEELGIK